MEGKPALPLGLLTPLKDGGQTRCGQMVSAAAAADLEKEMKEVERLKSRILELKRLLDQRKKQQQMLFEDSVSVDSNDQSVTISRPFHPALLVLPCHPALPSECFSRTPAVNHPYPPSSVRTPALVIILSLPRRPSPHQFSPLSPSSSPFLCVRAELCWL